MGWLKKDKNKEIETQDSAKNDTDGFSDFQDALDKSIVEEKTQVLMSKKNKSKYLDIAKVLFKNGYTVEEINTFSRSNKKFSIQGGEIIDI